MVCLATSMTAAPALSAAGLYKAFGSTQALRGANLELEAGRIRALLGENGSGKSTLAKIIAGAQSADRGTITRNGTEVTIADPASARGLVSPWFSRSFRSLPISTSLTICF